MSVTCNARCHVLTVCTSNNQLEHAQHHTDEWYTILCQSIDQWQVGLSCITYYGTCVVCAGSSIEVLDTGYVEWTDIDGMGSVQWSDKTSDWWLEKRSWTLASPAKRKHNKIPVTELQVNSRSPAVAGMGRPFRDVELTVSIGLIEVTHTWNVTLILSLRTLLTDDGVQNTPLASQLTKV